MRIPRHLAGLGIGVAMLAMTGSAAFADTLLILGGPVPGNTVGPQSSSNPCVIAGTTCQQPALMGYNNFANNGSSTAFNEYSTNAGTQNNDAPGSGNPGTPYTVQQLINLGSTSFIVGIDVNTANPGTPGETLTLFEVLNLTTGLTIAHFTGAAGSHNIGLPANNGNGFADYTLSTISLAGLALTDRILFHAVWSDASDGSESFFLIPTAAPVPGPMAGAGVPGLILACGGLIALARRRRKARALA